MYRTPVIRARKRERERERFFVSQILSSGSLNKKILRAMRVEEKGPRRTAQILSLISTSSL